MAKFATLRVTRAQGTGGHNAELDAYYSHLVAYGPTPEDAIRRLLREPAMLEVYRPYCEKVLAGLIGWTYSYTDVAIGIQFSTMVL